MAGQRSGRVVRNWLRPQEVVGVVEEVRRSEELILEVREVAWRSREAFERVRGKLSEEGCLRSQDVRGGQRKWASGSEKLAEARKLSEVRGKPWGKVREVGEVRKGPGQR
ncbi:hypothetical protein FNV43_RR21399 [Rhamnella rubrinervis]|uniref:Uncharacterized protein n=1 Tax=Rhamnella rubrinervis TaxID=2594499 RepID=A0A8K0DXT5_9ROSA|nr:hypothetical protein FNV43_RR21399 [Rhamnella rubrinervis]